MTCRRLSVGIGDVAVATESDLMLVSYALGSCVAVAVTAPGLAGLCHALLPEAIMDIDRAQRRPGMFADAGLDFLLDQLESRGARPSQMRAVLVGGARLPGSGSLSIGADNQRACRARLKARGVWIDSEEVGGEVSRTVLLHVGTGRVWVRTANRAWEL